MPLSFDDAVQLHSKVLFAFKSESEQIAKSTVVALRNCLDQPFLAQLSPCVIVRQLLIAKLVAMYYFGFERLVKRLQPSSILVTIPGT